MITDNVVCSVWRQSTKRPGIDNHIAPTTTRRHAVTESAHCTRVQYWRHHANKFYQSVSISSLLRHDAFNATVSSLTCFSRAYQIYTETPSSDQRLEPAVETQPPKAAAAESHLQLQKRGNARTENQNARKELQRTTFSCHFQPLQLRSGEFDRSQKNAGL